jgi:hypothetical protein
MCACGNIRVSQNALQQRKTAKFHSGFVRLGLIIIPKFFSTSANGKELFPGWSKMAFFFSVFRLRKIAKNDKMMVMEGKNLQ